MLRHLAIAKAVLLATLCASAFAQAQVPTSLIGSWKATWQTEQRSYEATMTVTETGGSWQTATRNRHNPCVGREVPMKIESFTSTSVQFELQFSEVIPGCPNVTVALRLAPDGSVTGTRSNYDLTLRKK